MIKLNTEYSTLVLYEYLIDPSIMNDIIEIKILN